MLYDLMRNYLGPSAAPFAAIAFFVIVVGVSLWLTPRLAGWIDRRREKVRGFYDDMLERPPENAHEEKTNDGE